MPRWLSEALGDFAFFPVVLLAPVVPLLIFTGVAWCWKRWRRKT
jgi:hypothetical protein